MEERKNKRSNQSENENRDQGLDLALDSASDIIILFCGLLLAFVLLFRVVVVSGPSMKNSLVDGDYLLLLSSTFYGDPEPGDIVVVSKADFKDGEPIVKRVIATEGQTVRIDGNTGEVYVDGQLLDEEYIMTPSSSGRYGSMEVTVAEGCVFVMGDNRANSKDSRDSAIGQVDVRQIVGKAIFLVFPGNEEGRIERDFGRIGAP